MNDWVMHCDVLVLPIAFARPKCPPLPCAVLARTNKSIASVCKSGRWQCICTALMHMLQPGCTIHTCDLITRLGSWPTANTTLLLCCCSLSQITDNCGGSFKATFSGGCTDSANAGGCRISGGLLCVTADKAPATADTGGRRLKGSSSSAASSGRPRVYTAQVSVADSAGNAVLMPVRVEVPEDRSSKASTAGCRAATAKCW